jgi:hypothetical protein
VPLAGETQALLHFLNPDILQGSGQSCRACRAIRACRACTRNSTEKSEFETGHVGPCEISCAFCLVLPQHPFLGHADASNVPVCGSKDRVPVIEMRIDELGRRYYWNHTEMTSDWKPPPPQIGFWQRLMDYRRVFLSYKQHGDAMRFLANVCPRLPTACFSAVH